MHGGGPGAGSEREIEDEAHLRALIDEERARFGELLPPWARFPEFAPGDLAWGNGEVQLYSAAWELWLEDALPDEEARRAQFLRFAAPPSWRVVLPYYLAPARPRHEHAALLREHHAAGGFAPDVAYQHWRRLQGATPPAPPWARGRDLEGAVHSAPRALTFFVRLLAESRKDASALPLGTPPSGTWSRFVALLEDPGAASESDSDTTLPAEQLGLGLATDGRDAPPPWTRGESSDALQRPETYAQAWSSWAFDVFDDAESWREYLTRWAIPTSWEHAVRAAVGAGIEAHRIV